MKHVARFLVLAIVALPLASCMTRTVTDANGNVIYSEPVVGTPWQPEKRRTKQVQKKQEALGWP